MQNTKRISTTLRHQEYIDLKKLGLPWNRLIRMGAQLAKSNFHTQTNKRLEELEKASEEYRRRYYEVRRELIKLENPEIKN